jgi:hypothetical protein
VSTVDGNEESDQLANRGSEPYLIGPEPFFGYSSMKYKTDLNEWIEQRKKDHFSDLPSDSLAKRFLSYSFNGHFGLRYHMHRIGKGLEDTYRLCMEESETAQHVMCECPAVAWIRLETFGKGFMSPQTVKSLKPKSILGFLKAVQPEEI